MTQLEDRTCDFSYSEPTLISGGAVTTDMDQWDKKYRHETAIILFIHFILFGVVNVKIF